MNHKNPELRTNSPIIAVKAVDASTPKVGVSAPAQKKPARMELEDGNKWIVVSIEFAIDRIRPGGCNLLFR